jgi:hypothetical protein
MRRVLLVSLAVFGIASVNALADDGHATVAFNGRIAGFTTASITARDGGRALTCLLTTASPGVTSFQVGDHVQLACRRHVLVAIALKNTIVTSPPQTTPPAAATTTPTTGGTGDGHRSVTPTTSPTPSVTPAGSTTPSVTATSAFAGTVTALSSTSITVHHGGRDLTCTAGGGSPSFTGYPVGTHVKIACTSGVLSSIVGIATSVPTITAPTTTTPTTSGEPTNAPAPSTSRSTTLTSPPVTPA